jgi:hypothetical protein
MGHPARHVAAEYTSYFDQYVHYILKHKHTPCATFIETLRYTGL